MAPQLAAQTSTDANTSHQFGAANTYNVTLTVTNTAGSNSFSMPISVMRLQAPVANFTADQTTITENGIVNFTDTSTGQIDSYLWDFGDGQSSTDANTSHQYATANTYNVTLTVTNTAGSNSFSLPITVNADLQALVANFTADPTTVVENQTVNFTMHLNGTNRQLSLGFW